MNEEKQTTQKTPTVLKQSQEKKISNVSLQFSTETIKLESLSIKKRPECKNSGRHN